MDHKFHKSDANVNRSLEHGKYCAGRIRVLRRRPGREIVIQPDSGMYGPLDGLRSRRVGEGDRAMRSPSSHLVTAVATAIGTAAVLVAVTLAAGLPAGAREPGPPPGCGRRAVGGPDHRGVPGPHPPLFHP